MLGIRRVGLLGDVEDAGDITIHRLDDMREPLAPRLDDSAHDPARVDELVDDDVVSRMVMKGRPMNGWLLVVADRLDDDALARYVELGSDFARSLPAK